MKKLFVIMLFAAVCVLAAEDLVTGQPGGSNNPGGGSATDNSADGSDNSGMIGQRIHVPEQQMEMLRDRIQERERVMNQELQTLPEPQRNTLRNQNELRVAVHAMKDVEDLIPGYGPRIAEYAREFNNSVQATIRAENRIHSRNALTRFFAGGDAEAAQTLREEVARNQERIQAMERLADECCNGEVHKLLQNQLRTMQQEQTRLQELARQEQARKGLFGWIWK